MRGEASPVHIAALLMGLRAKGETADELAGAALALRCAMTRLDVPGPDGERTTHALYELLAAEDPASAHGRYNALIRRLVSYLRAAEHAAAR